MKKQHIFYGYVLIGFGVFFLIKQLDLVWFQPYESWPTFLIIVGVSFLIHSYSYRVYENIFIGILLLGLGIHFHGLERFSFWVDHWSIYILIAGIGFLIRYVKTRSGLIVGAILVGIAVIMLFSVTLPAWFTWIYGVIDFLETFWPVTLIAIGVYLLRVKR